VTPPAEATQWRAWGESWLAVLIPAVVAFGGLLFVLQGIGFGRNALGVLVALFGLVLVAAGLLLLVVLYRTRTRLTSEGIEIRQTRPEVLPWSDIAGVERDRATGRRTIKVSLRGGGTRTLPTPTQGKRALSDSTLDDAVAAMRRRLR
jgi:hypothetical protein